MEQAEDEDSRLRASGARVEQLLGELERTAGPTTWPRVQELTQRLVGLYGAGLERLLGHLRHLAGPPELAARLASDELVSNLLLLHGLHPLSTEERIRRALEELKPYLSSHAGGIELIGVDPQGGVRVRLQGTCRHCPSSGATVERTIRRAIEEAAPEVTRLEVEQEDGADAAPTVVALGAPVPKQKEDRWVTLEGMAVAPGARQVVEVRGTEVLLIKPDEHLLAFQSRCSACAARLDQAQQAGPLLICSGCGGRYDLARAGQSVSGGRGLAPVPLLEQGSRVRLSIAEAQG